MNNNNKVVFLSFHPRHKNDYFVKPTLLWNRSISNKYKIRFMGHLSGEAYPSASFSWAEKLAHLGNNG